MKKGQFIAYLILIGFSFAYLLGYEMFFSASESVSFKSIIIIMSVFFAIVIIYAILMAIFKKVNPQIYKKMYDFIIESEDYEFDGDKYINELRSKIVNFKFLGEEVIEKNKDILELMLENMKEIKDYYVISKRQSNRSFTLAVSMCIVGLFFIATSIVLAFVTDLSFGITLIPAIGGSIAELIAGTSLVVYKSSVEQLNNYYKALHNNERFLSLVNLVSKVSPEKQDDVYINIINTELQNYRNSNN